MFQTPLRSVRIRATIRDEGKKREKEKRGRERERNRRRRKENNKRKNVRATTRSSISVSDHSLQVLRENTRDEEKAFLYIKRFWKPTRENLGDSLSRVRVSQLSSIFPTRSRSRFSSNDVSVATIPAGIHGHNVPISSLGPRGSRVRRERGASCLRRQFWTNP